MMASNQYVRVAYTDPAKSGEPMMVEYDGKYWIWDPPGGGQFKVHTYIEDGRVKKTTLKISDKIGKNFVDVPADMLRRLFDGDTMKRYRELSKDKAAPNPFQKIEVLLENLDRQQDALRQENERLRTEAETFKRNLEQQRVEDRVAMDRTIANLQEELRVARSSVAATVKK